MSLLAGRSKNDSTDGEEPPEGGTHPTNTEVYPLMESVMKKPEHIHTPEEERRIRDAALDETLKESFPASDPPSTIPNPDDDEALEQAS